MFLGFWLYIAFESSCRPIPHPSITTITTVLLAMHISIYTPPVLVISTLLKPLTIIYTSYILCIMKTVITLKADKEVKESAQKVAAELGLTLSAVVNASLKQFVREKSLN